MTAGPTKPPPGEPRSPKAPPRAIRRKSVGPSQQDWVEVRPMFEGKPYPTVLRARVEGLNLAEWAASNRDWVQALYEDKRSLVFQGFELAGFDGPKSFGAFVDAVSDGPRLPYLDRTTPRQKYGDNVYCTTVFPADQRMPQHNEGSYWIAWSLKAFMHCAVAAETGGETPIADVHNVYSRIDPGIRDEFQRRRWQLVRNFNDGFGLPWQEVFQTRSRAEVEEFCRHNRIEPTWKDGDRLRTCQTRSAVRMHAKTGEPLWFNHAAFYHICSRPAVMQQALLGEFGEDDLPFHTHYGDGGRIEPAVIEHINAAFDAEEIMWPWRQGDVHLFDNMRLSHGRQPYAGDRLILVALTEPYFDPDAAP